MNYENHFFLLIVLLLLDTMKKRAPKEGNCILDPENFVVWFLTLVERILTVYFELSLSPKCPMWVRWVWFDFNYRSFFYCYLFSSIFMSYLIDSIRLSLLNKFSYANCSSSSDWRTCLLENKPRFYCFKILLTRTEGLSEVSNFYGDFGLLSCFLIYCNLTEANWSSLAYLDNKALEKFLSVKCI